MPEEKQNHIIQAIKSYGKGLLGFIRKRVKSDADAEDILQDVWYQLSAVVNAEPIEQTGAWLYKVATNKIIDKNRKKTEELLDLSPGEDGDDDDAPDFRAILLTEGTTPETEYLRSLFWEALQEALAELPAEQSEAFVQNEIEGIAFKDIERQTGVSVATLISRKRYAVLHLRERLGVLKNELLNY